MSESPVAGPDYVNPDWVRSVANGQFTALRRRQFPFRSGRRLELSAPRKFICDLLHFAKKVPSVPMQRRMHLGAVAAARDSASVRIGWCAIFTKAFAMVSASWPELRRSHLSFPFGHLYEHPGVIASVAIERDFAGERGICFGKIPSPDLLRLVEVEALIQHYKTSPAESVPGYKTVLRLGRLPAPVRRFLWWFGLNGRGLYRAALFGTFGISVVAALGASGLHLLSPLTTTINYGTFESNAELDVRMAYDHRVMDGGTAARIMADLEAVLLGEIVEELRGLAARSIGDPAAA